jgi:hypothetical protein
MLKPSSFSENRSLKNGGIILFWFRRRVGVFKRLGRRLTQHFFHQIKDRQQIGRKVSIPNKKRGFHTSRPPKNEGSREIFVLNSQELQERKKIKLKKKRKKNMRRLMNKAKS